LCGKRLRDLDPGPTPRAARGRSWVDGPAPGVWEPANRLGVTGPGLPARLGHPRCHREGHPPRRFAPSGVSPGREKLRSGVAGRQLATNSTSAATGNGAPRHRRAFAPSAPVARVRSRSVSRDRFLLLFRLLHRPSLVDLLGSTDHTRGRRRRRDRSALALRQPRPHHHVERRRHRR
jgi:hypothetical protein